MEEGDVNQNTHQNQQEEWQKKTHHLLNIFPEEIWAIILEYVTEVENLKILNETAPFFQTRLEKKRILYLFPKVMPLLYPALQIKVPWKSTRKLKLCSEILKLRQVCKAWCSGVDSLAENTGLPLHDNKHWGTNRIYRKRKIRRCLEHFEGTHGKVEVIRNPFVGRYIVLQWTLMSGCKDPEEKDYEEWPLLEKFGEHMWHSLIFIKLTSGGPPRSVYHWMLSVLKLMPNLKTLDIKLFEQPCGGFVQSGISLKPEHFPKLEKLEYLRIYKGQSREKIVDGLPGKCGVFKFFQPNSNQKVDTGFGLLSMPGSALKQLSLKIESEEDFRTLKNSPIDWSLQKLKLEFGRWFQQGWAEIFNFVTRYADTLTELSIRLPEIRRGTRDSNPVFNLPKLKRLSVVLVNSWSLDFLLPLRDTLEEFCVEVWLELDKLTAIKGAPPSDDGQNQNQCSVPLLEIRDAPANARIWKLMPKLKRLHLEEFCFYEDNLTTRKRICTGEQSREEWLQEKKFNWTVLKHSGQM